MTKISVEQGQTLGGIAQQYKTDVATLQKLNPTIQNPDLITIGQQLEVPDLQAQPLDQQSTGAVSFGVTKTPAGPTQTDTQPVPDKKATEQQKTPIVQPPLPPTPPQVNVQEAQKKLDDLKAKAQAIQASVKALPQDQLTDQGVVGKAVEEATLGVDESKVSYPAEAQDVITRGYENLQNLLNSYNELSSGPNLVETYKGLLESSGVAADKLELVNLENIMNGTKDDIRLELENAGVPLTESGVEYLTAIRNNKLQQKATNLQNAINDKEDYIDKVVELTGEDRKAVETRINNQFGFQKSELELAQSMVKMQQDSAKAYNDFLEKQQDNGRTRVLAMTSTGAIADSSDERLEQLALESGYDVEDLKAMRSATRSNNDLKLQNALLNLALKQDKAEAQNIFSTISDKPIDKAIYDGMNNATQGLSESTRKQVASQINKELSEGDYTRAKETLVRAATQSAGIDQKNAALARLQTIDALGDVKELLDTYVQKSGDTNILRGNIQQALNKMGTSGSPELVKIGTRIDLALQAYRRAMTGVAFSPQEAASYARIFPNITDTNKFNVAKIDALKGAFDAQQRVFLGSQIGTTNYDEIFKPEVTSLEDFYVNNPEQKDTILQELQQGSSVEEILNWLNNR